MTSKLSRAVHAKFMARDGERVLACGLGAILGNAAFSGKSTAVHNCAGHFCQPGRVNVQQAQDKRTRIGVSGCVGAVGTRRRRSLGLDLCTVPSPVADVAEVPLLSRLGGRFSGPELGSVMVEKASCGSHLARTIDPSFGVGWGSLRQGD